jgi:hypothetical protein
MKDTGSLLTFFAGLDGQLKFKLPGDLLAW